MDILLSPLGVRGLAGFGGLFFFLAIENLFPFRRRVDPILRHYGTNLLLAGANAFILNLLLGGLIIGYADFLNRRGIGLLKVFPVTPFWNIILSLLYLDFVTYLWHMGYHRIPLLWRLHRVHHSDRDLDVTSASRFHLLEVSFSILLRLAAVTVWGPAPFSILIFEGGLLAAAQFQHSNFKIPFDSALRFIFVTPDMHRIHHSDLPMETNSNYATIFSFWDRMIGTYRIAPQERIVIGIKSHPDPKDRTVGALLLMPFGPPCPEETLEA